MGNAQRGTRGMSSSDLTRLKRLRGAAGYQALTQTNADLTALPANQVSYNPPILVSNVVGTSRIRRTASQWTDFKAFGSADYVIQGQLVNPNGNVNVGGVVPKQQWLCSNCSGATPARAELPLTSKPGLCKTCAYDPKWRVTPE